MRQINPIAKAWSNAEKNQVRAQRNKNRWAKSAKRGNEYLAQSHKFERTFSDKPVGEFRVMTGAEAKRLNEKLFEDFLVAMHKNKKGRSLERWKLAERNIEVDCKSLNSKEDAEQA